MGICWSCYWGWSNPVAEIYQRALSRLDGYKDPLHYGPAHVVWEDENFDCAEWCLDHFNDQVGEYDYNVNQLQIVRQSLEELAAIPLAIRCPEPENYDEEHPELFPPPAHVAMVKQ